MSGRNYKLKELARLVGGELFGDGNTAISGVAGIKEAKRGDITFLANPKYEAYVDTTLASAIIGPPEIRFKRPAIRIENPYLAFLKVLTLFAGDAAEKYERGVHSSSVIDPSAELGANICIGPFCQIEGGARIGANSTILFGVYVGEGVMIGENCLVYPNVTIREGCEIGNRVIIHPGVVIGADGFGFAKDGSAHQKIPQIGKVYIEDDVEIGANTTVDRATTGTTRICSGTKIDNLVQIAHNVVVGRNCIIAAQVGISGSTELGEGVVLAGQAGLVGHIKLGDGATVGAQGGVTKSVPPHTTVSGYPAREHSVAKRLNAYASKLPDLYKRVRELEARIAELEREKNGDKTAKDD